MALEAVLFGMLQAVQNITVVASSDSHLVAILDLAELNLFLFHLRGGYS
jgi:hypothetical protein